LQIAFYLGLEDHEFIDDDALEVVLLFDDLVEAEQVLILDDLLLVQDHLVLEDDVHLLGGEEVRDFLLDASVLLDPGHLDDADEVFVADALQL
jgi:hypothetical protein